LFSHSFGFVADKLFKLVETPIVKFPVKVFTSTFLNANAGQVFKSNHIKGHIDNVFGNTMVNIRHKPSFLSADLLKKTFSRFGAFGLEVLPQICIFSSCIFDAARIEKDIIGTNRDINNPSINTENCITDRFRRFGAKCDMQIENILPAVISKRGTPNIPSKVLFVVFRYIERDIYSAVDGCNRSKSMFENNTDDSLDMS